MDQGASTRRPLVTPQALYVDVENGPYRAILGEENCWGEERNAIQAVSPLAERPEHHPRDCPSRKDMSATCNCGVRRARENWRP